MCVVSITLLEAELLLMSTGLMKAFAQMNFLTQLGKYEPRELQQQGLQSKWLQMAADLLYHGGSRSTK